MANLKPIAHDDRLTVVEHLDELRTRIVISLLALALASGLCFWQNHRLLEILNKPLPDGQQPITLSPTEPFLTTITLSAYAGILLALPVLLYQLYAFVVPAFSPNERRATVPMLLLVPLLFVGGVLFAYFVVLEPAIDFLLGFNADEFDTELRAREYYGFASLMMIAMGLLFQVPVGVLTLTRLGVVTVEQLRKNRRYAILVLVIVAALLPTVDPVTLAFETIPLIALYELSILLAAALGRGSEEADDEAAGEVASDDEPAPAEGA